MNKKLKELKESVDKQFGKGSVILFGEDSDLFNIKVIPTGIFSLDRSLGIGGIPRGRMIEIYGPNSTGKTTLALYVAASAQKQGEIVAYLDLENSLDRNLANDLGVNVDSLLFSQPDCAENALEILEYLVRSGEVGLIVVDSVAALVPRAELSGEMGDSVSSDTPVFIRHKTKKYTDIVPIEDLYGGGDNFLGKQRIYKKTKNIEILTHNGWKPLLAVIKKKNDTKKNLSLIRTTTGYIKTTEDHSLFQDGKEVSPKELNIFDRIDVHNTNDFNFNLSGVNKNIAWLLGFWCAEGSTNNNDCKKNRFEVCNINLNLINKCKEIIDSNFPTIGKIRRPKSKDSRNLLYILTCNADSDLGFLIEECRTKKSSLKKVPSLILNASSEIKESFLDGFFQGDGSHGNKHGKIYYYNNSLPMIAGIQYLLHSLNRKTAIRLDRKRPEQLILEQVESLFHRENEIRDKITLDPPNFLYDVSTESGTFVAAIGNIVCHNSHMGLQARLMSQAMRKLVGVTNKTGTTVIWINQTRQNIGQFYGPNEVTSGGNALKFYSSIRLEVRKGETLKEKDTVIGHSLKIKVVKNKLSSPFTTSECSLIYGKGIDIAGDLFDTAIISDIIKKSGSWYSYDDKRLGQGRDQSIQFLIEQGLLDEITKKLQKQEPPSAVPEEVKSTK